MIAGPASEGIRSSRRQGESPFVRPAAPDQTMSRIGKPNVNTPEEEGGPLRRSRFVTEGDRGQGSGDRGHDRGQVTIGLRFASYMR